MTAAPSEGEAWKAARRLSVLLVGFPERVASDLALFLQTAEIRHESLVHVEKTLALIPRLLLPVVLLHWPTENRREADLLSRLRGLPGWVPILALGESDNPAARREAWERGADFLLRVRGSEQELLAILGSLGRRCDRSAPARLDRIPPTLDRGKRLLRRGGREVALTPTEFAIASYLFRHAGRIVLIEELAVQLRRHRPRHAPLARILHVHLANLRRKLNRSATGIRLRSVRGRGLVWEWKPEWPPGAS